MLDQLQERLAAVMQTAAFFEFVEQRDDLARQPEQHVFAAGGANSLAVSATAFSRRKRYAVGHRAIQITLLAMTVGLILCFVYRFFSRKRA
jgi:hypothetical protein